jgi:hypothetical protein
MELDVIYPTPGPYARGKDCTLYGSRSMVPSMGGMTMGFYGAEAAAAAAAPASSPAPAPAPASKKAKKAKKAKPKDLGTQVRNLFKKDESGESKAEKIAKRAAQIVGPRPPPPPPAPTIVQAPAPAASAGMSPVVQIALVGVAAFVVGGGIGYVVGRR